MLLGYLLKGVVVILSFVVTPYKWVVIIACLLSWVRPDPSNPVVRMIYQLTEPVFAFVRRYLPKALWKTGLDFSPIVVILVLVLIESVLIQYLSVLSAQLILGSELPI